MIRQELIRFFLFVCTGCLPAFVQGQGELAHGLVLQINPGTGNPRNSEGDFVSLKSGRILFIYTRYYGDAGRDHSPAHLAGRYSDDGGLTWSKEDEVIVPNEGKSNIRSVSLLRLRNGDIALFYLLQHSLEDQIPMMRLSSDEGRTWSEPSPCITDQKGYFVVNNNRVIQLKSGRLLMPVSLHKTPGGTWTNKGTIQSYYSDNEGKAWLPGRVVASDDSVITQEPAVVELKDGSVLMLMRANGGVQYLSYSRDKGKTWSPAVPSNISSPISPASVARIPSTRDLLLVWNNNGEKGPGYFKGKRTPLTLAVSKDEGKNWQHRQNIEDDPEGTFCYTAIHFTGKSHVLLAYSMGTSLPYLRLVRLSVKEIYK